jgi:hypothetical protein
LRHQCRASGSLGVRSLEVSPNPPVGPGAQWAASTVTCEADGCNTSFQI